MHTPGPWNVYSYPTICGSYNKAIDVGPSGKAVARIIGAFEQGDVGPEATANARLIAAAPDLLQALKVLCAAYEDALGRCDPEYDAARAAISKAEAK